MNIEPGGTVKPSLTVGLLHRISGSAPLKSIGRHVWSTNLRFRDRQTGDEDLGVVCEAETINAVG
jgi:hypothetical protein